MVAETPGTVKKGHCEIELKSGVRINIPATLSDSGALAFHRQVDSSGNNTKRWTITHTRTGRVIKHCRLSTECRAIVKRLDEYGFELGVGYNDTNKKTELKGIVDKIVQEVEEDDERRRARKAAAS